VCVCANAVCVTVSVTLSRARSVRVCAGAVLGTAGGGGHVQAVPSAAEAVQQCATQTYRLLSHSPYTPNKCVYTLGVYFAARFLFAILFVLVPSLYNSYM
jgi:hypothetical protein